MLKIAICDDNIADLSNMCEVIDQYKTLQRDKHAVEYTAFQSAVDLIAALENGQEYELIFLDILMPLLNGMDAAKEIRQFNSSIVIIFLTSSPEFAVESYMVDAYYYALKPIWKDKLFILLDKVIAKLDNYEGTSLLIKSKTGLTRIYINKLEFSEIIGRTILYHLVDGSIIEAVGSMTELEKKLLENPCFIKVHRSYIINLDYISNLSSKIITMSSLSLVPVAKANYQTVKLAYIDYSFHELTFPTKTEF